MAAPILVPCGVQLRAEFDLIAPSRGKASDGWIGDTVHQAEVSDHNDDEVGRVPIHDADKVHEVHAVDVTTELNESDLTMEKVVQSILARCRSGLEKRLRYIIFNRRIWRASNGWKQEAYAGTADPHIGHAHFSFSYETNLEASTASYRLEDIPVALTEADKKWIAADNDRACKAATADLLAAKIGDAAFPDRRVGDVLRDVAKLRGVLVGDPGDTRNAALSPTSPLAKLLAVPAELQKPATPPAS